MGKFSLGAEFLSVLASFGLVCVILGMLFVIGRRLQSQQRGGPDSGAIRIIGSRRLGLQASLILVEVEGRRVLLGHSKAGLVLMNLFGAEQSALAEDRRAQQSVPPC